MFHINPGMEKSPLLSLVFFKEKTSQNDSFFHFGVNISLPVFRVFPQNCINTVFSTICTKEISRFGLLHSDMHLPLGFIRFLIINSIYLNISQFRLIGCKIYNNGILEVLEMAIYNKALFVHIPL